MTENILQVIPLIADTVRLLKNGIEKRSYEFPMEGSPL